MNPKLSDREMIRLAKEELGDLEYHVWVLHHYAKLGRTLGATHLGISESAWRHRLKEADRKMHKALEERSAAA